MNDGKRERLLRGSISMITERSRCCITMLASGVGRKSIQFKVNTIRTHTRPSHVYASSKLKSQVRTTLLSGSGTLKQG